MLLTQVLNQQLYDQLDRLFGEVRVAQPGVSAIVVSTTSLFDADGGVGGYKIEAKGAGEYYRVCCPFCEDTKFRLWVNHLFGSTEYAGERFWFAAVCYNEDCLKHDDNFHSFRDAIFDKLAKVEFKVRRGVKRAAGPRVVSSPGQCVPLLGLADDHPAHEYLTARGYDSRWLAKRFGLTYCTESRMRMMVGRIVIPVKVNGKLVTWQGRYVGEPVKKGPPKYWNAPGLATALYNHDSLIRFKQVVLVEGATGVWKFGPEAGGLFGKRISPAQINLLEDGGTKSVILLLDPDKAPDDVLRNRPHHMTVAYEALRPHFKTLPVYLPKGTDPGLYDRRRLLKFIRAACEQKNFKCLLGMTENRKDCQ